MSVQRRPPRSLKPSRNKWGVYGTRFRDCQLAQKTSGRTNDMKAKKYRCAEKTNDCRRNSDGKEMELQLQDVKKIPGYTCQDVFAFGLILRLSCSLEFESFHQDTIDVRSVTTEHGIRTQSVSLKEKLLFLAEILYLAQQEPTFQAPCCNVMNMFSTSCCCFGGHSVCLSLSLSVHLLCTDGHCVRLLRLVDIPSGHIVVSSFCVYAHVLEIWSMARDLGISSGLKSNLDASATMCLVIAGDWSRRRTSTCRICGYRRHRSQAGSSRRSART